MKVKKGLDGETLDREALAGLSEEKYEVHILAKDKGNIIPTHYSHLAGLFLAILGKDPWLKLGKNDRLNIKIGRK